MPTIEANGQTLYYEEHGEGEPLLAVMGLSADILAWALQVHDFSAGHRLVIFDNRDVGRSSMADGPYEVADMAQDALALAEGLELDTFHLLGYSMGGAIAQDMALAAPERLRTLTLSVTYASAGAWGRKLAETWGKRRLGQSHEDFIDELLLLNLSEEFYENEAGLDYVRSMMLANPNPQPPEAFVRQLEASARHDARDRLGSIEVPTHVIGGEHDLLVPVWKQQELAAAIPEAQLSVLKGAPHGMNIERAQEFNELVLDFIAERTAAPV